MSQPTHSALAPISTTNRSKVTNARLRGKVTARSLFVDGDGRTPWARRYRDLVGLLVDDAGGLETMTELKLSLCRRAAALIVECERMENALADGEEIDIDLLARMSSHTRRISETIGLNRVKRDITPTLAELVATHKAAKAAAASIEAKPVKPAKTIDATPAAPQPAPLTGDPSPLDDEAFSLVDEPNAFLEEATS
jgi:hypothetical protein